MAIVPQPSLFSWHKIDDLGDLDRLRLAIKYMPDEPLMQALEARRGLRGRDDYPIRPMWNALLAGVVFQHPTVESLRRELSRNIQLRALCGFDLLTGLAAIPTASAFSRFVQSLSDHDEALQALFDDLVDALSERLPAFGQDLALDGKAIASFARGRKKDAPVQARDGRRDTDANWGVKTYTIDRDDGSSQQKAVRWFGYKLHLIVDATYELPVAYKMTRASASEITEAHQLIPALAKTHPDLVERCDALMADRGLDDGKFNRLLWEDYQIRPVIDARKLWKTTDAKLLPGHDRVLYDQQGRLYCWCSQSSRRQAMAFAGFESGRQTLKFRCPAKHYGMHCPGQTQCRIGSQVRVKLDVDRRLFTPLARCSGQWQKRYNKRTSVERVNSRLDVSFGFERHTIRGLAKMNQRMGVALSVMLAMALGRVKEKQEPHLRSLLRVA